MSACEIFELHFKVGWASHHGSLYCASGECPDEGEIPEGCRGKCVKGKGDASSIKPEHCKSVERRMCCPCARPADPRRWAKFEDWKASLDVREELWQMRHVLYARRRVTLEW